MAVVLWSAKGPVGDRDEAQPEAPEAAARARHARQRQRAVGADGRVREGARGKSSSSAVRSVGAAPPRASACATSATVSSSPGRSSRNANGSSLSRSSRNDLLGRPHTRCTASMGVSVAQRPRRPSTSPSTSMVSATFKNEKKRMKQQKKKKFSASLLCFSKSSATPKRERNGLT